MDFLAEALSLEVIMNKLTQARGTHLVFYNSIIMITVTHFQYAFLIESYSHLGCGDTHHSCCPGTTRVQSEYFMSGIFTRGMLIIKCFN